MATVTNGIFEIFSDIHNKYCENCPTTKKNTTANGCSSGPTHNTAKKPHTNNAEEGIDVSRLPATAANEISPK